MFICLHSYLYERVNGIVTIPSSHLEIQRADEIPAVYFRLFHVAILIFCLSSLGKNTELYSMQLKNLLQMKRILIINRFNNK